MKLEGEHTKKRWKTHPHLLEEDSIVKSISDKVKSIWAKSKGTPFDRWEVTKVKLTNLLKHHQTIMFKNKNKRNQKISNLLNLEDNAPAIIKEIAQKNEETLLKNKIQSHLSHGKPCKALTAKIKAKEKDIRIPSLRSEEGVIISGRAEKLERAHQFYTRMFDKAPFCRNCVTKLFNNWKPKYPKWIDKELSKETEDEEIINQLNKLDIHSAPGPDGITNRVYKKLGPVIVPIIKAMMNYMLEGNELPKQFKEGIVITIYKGKGDPLDLSNRRPITLLNNDYKILSGILNNRLLLLTPNIIQNSQTRFVPNRFIIDNIITVNELIRDPQEKILSFLDIEKAFDSVSHGAINHTLYLLNLPPNIRAAIKGLLNNSSIQISINGDLTKKIPVQRGVKQGDPISPTLFVLIMELLGRSINKLEGCNLGDDKITSIMFADDTVIVSKNNKELDEALKILKIFTAATNLKVNKTKCDMIIKGCHITTNPFQVLEGDRTIRYLGYWFNKQGIVNELKKRIQHMCISMDKWRNMFSNINTKMILLKSYSLSQIAYWLYVERITKSDMSKIEAKIDHFLYGGPKKMRRERERRPYSEGGIGRWSLGARSVAYKASTFCNAITGKSILAKYWTKNIFNYSVNSVEHSHSHMSVYAYKCYCQIMNIPNMNRVETLLEIAKDVKQNPPKIKNMYERYISNHYPTKETLTPDQEKWKNEYNINYTELWRNIRKLYASTKDKELIWSFFQNLLPYNRSNKCPSCDKTQSKTHIFFECPRVTNIMKEVHNTVVLKWRIKCPPWDLRCLINLVNRKLQKPVIINTTIITTAMRIIWITYNSLTHENERKTRFTQALMESSLKVEINKTFKLMWIKVESESEDPIDHLTRIETIHRLGLQTWKMKGEYITPP